MKITLCRLLTLAICTLISVQRAEAATFAVDPGRGVDVVLSGQIEPGDANKLLHVLRKVAPKATTIYLNSPGGALAEALLLATIVERAALSTVVAESGICASACFFVWLAGTERKAATYEMMQSPSLQRQIRELAGSLTGYIGLHRPFDKGVQSVQISQPAIMRSVAEYLERKLVPRRIVDSMMTRPSNDIYWMTEEDLLDLGTYAPPLEEYLIQRCGYDRNSHIKELEALGAGNKVRAAQIRAAQEQSDACEAEELYRLSREGLAEIQRGWRP